MSKIRLELEFEQFKELLMFSLEHEHEYSEMANLAKILRIKLDKMAEHDLYSIYKDKTKTAEEQEQARQKYLEQKGIPNDFRW